MRVKYLGTSSGRARIAAEGRTVTIDIDDVRGGRFLFADAEGADEYVANLNEDNAETEIVQCLKRN